MSTPPPRFLASRLSLFYAAHFAAIGVLLPFWPVWLDGHGMSAPQIGVILAIGMAMKVVANPLAAHVADRTGHRKGVIIALTALAMACFSLFAFTEGFWAILAVNVLFFSFWPATLPLGESLTLMTARNHGLDYGRIRLWGSITFIAAAVIAGRGLSGGDISVVYWGALALVATKFGVSLILPATRAPRAVPGSLLMLDILKTKGFTPFLIACALIQSSHAVYYGFGTLHWRAAGLNETVIGGLWAEGVLAEIVLFVFGARLLLRFGPLNLIALGALAGLLRWPLMAFSTELPVLVVVQLLHAFTFGATHLGAMHHIANVLPADKSATAQAVYAAVVMGLAFAPAMFVAGWLYSEAQGQAYLAMTALVGIALVCIRYAHQK